MKVVVNKKALQSISTFYHNVRKKYKHTYSKEQMEKNIDEVCDVIQSIKDNGKVPILQKHKIKGYKEATWKRRGTKINWYFEYKVETDENNDYIIHVYEAINFRNMHENVQYLQKKALYESIMQDVAKIVKKAIEQNDK